MERLEIREVNWPMMADGSVSGQESVLLETLKAYKMFGWTEGWGKSFDGCEVIGEKWLEVGTGLQEKIGNAEFGGNLSSLFN